MNLKKILAAAMVASMTVAAAPILVPTAVQGVLVSEAEAARGGARIAPRSAPAAPKSSPSSSSSSGKAVSGNGSGYAGRRRRRHYLFGGSRYISNKTGMFGSDRLTH